MFLHVPVGMTAQWKVWSCGIRHSTELSLSWLQAQRVPNVRSMGKSHGRVLTSSPPSVRPKPVTRAMTVVTSLPAVVCEAAQR